MKKIGFAWVLGVLAFLSGWGSMAGVTDASGPLSGPAGKFKKVFVIVLENTDAGDALRQPFLRKFASQGAYLDRFFAVTHPSQPNYIALIGGDTLGVFTDGDVDLNAAHLGDLLEAKGKTWKAYNEDYPGGCFTGHVNGKYARKHNPFISFRNVQTNPARCASIVSASELARDVAEGKMAEFSLYVPDIDNDGHDTGVDYADQWFGHTFWPYLENPNFMRDMLVVVIFDESSWFGGNRIYAAFYGAGVRPGTVSQTEYGTYSLLRTIEDAFGLGTLGRNDRQASAITDIWN